VRQRYPHSSLIALPGGTSHANLLSGNTCLDNRIAAYLATGTLRRRKPGNGPDTTCAPHRPPAAEALSAIAQRPAAADRRMSRDPGDLQTKAPKNGPFAACPAPVVAGC
jgi:hypothetical protein